MDCIGGHLSPDLRLACAVQLSSVCGGIAREKVSSVFVFSIDPLIQGPTHNTTGRLPVLVSQACSTGCQDNVHSGQGLPASNCRQTRQVSGGKVL